MEFKALSVKTMTIDRKPYICFEVENLAHLGAWIDKAIKYTAMRIEAVKWADKRSLNANAYFHKMVGLLADAQKISNIHCKNKMIASYGQFEFLDGDVLMYKTKAPPEYMREQESPHTWFAGVELDGEDVVYVYYVYKPTHLYDTKEMATLIDGLVAECQDAGIETLTPDEIERLKALWQSKA